MAQTTPVKHLDECNFFALKEGPDDYLRFLSTIKVTGAAAASTDTNDAEDFSDSLSGNDAVVRIEYIPEGGLPDDMVLTVNGENVTIPAGAKEDNAYRVGSAAAGAGFDATAVVITSGGVAGVILEVLLLPAYSNSDKVGYMDSLSFSEPNSKRIVKDQGTRKHLKRMRTRERTLDATERFQNFNQGLQDFMGNEFTFIVEREDDGAGTVSEKMFFGGCLPPQEGASESSGDSDSNFSVSAEYERLAVTTF